MECLKGYTVEQIKEMNSEKLRMLWRTIVKEKQEMDMRHTIIDMLEIIEAKKSMIEN